MSKRRLSSSRRSDIENAHKHKFMSGSSNPNTNSLASNPQRKDSLEDFMKLITIEHTPTWKEFSSRYLSTQCVLIKNFAVKTEPAKEKWVGAKQINELISTNLSKFENTWGMESNAPKDSDEERKQLFAPCNILNEKNRSSTDRWYASFILQKDDELVNHFLSLCPISIPSFMNEKKNAVVHSKCIWVFFGQNLSSLPIQGRGEHIDQVYHSGTWHVQVCGEKIWNLRPNLEGEWPNTKRSPFFVHLHNDSSSSSDGMRFRVVVEEGDMLFLNTRLWFHATELPNTAIGRDKLSMSYARDFHICKKGQNANENVFCEPEMTNKTGAVASGRVQPEEIILRERPFFLVQSLRNKLKFICCEQCGRQVGNLDFSLSLFRERKRSNLIYEKISCLPLLTEDKTCPWFPTDVITEETEEEGKSETKTRQKAPRQKSSISSGSRKNFFCSRTCQMQWKAEGGQIYDKLHEFFLFASVSGFYDSFSLVAKFLTCLLVKSLKQDATQRSDEDRELKQKAKKGTEKEEIGNDVISDEERTKGMQNCLKYFDEPEGKTWWEIKAEEIKEEKKQEAQKKKVKKSSKQKVVKAFLPVLIEYTGLSFQDTNSKNKNEVIVADVQEGSPAWQQGVRKGYKLETVGKTVIYCLHDLENAREASEIERQEFSDEIMGKDYVSSSSLWAPVKWKFSSTPATSASASASASYWSLISFVHALSSSSSHNANPSTASSVAENLKEIALHARSIFFDCLEKQVRSLSSSSLSAASVSPPSTASFLLASSPTLIESFYKLRAFFDSNAFGILLGTFEDKSWQLNKGSVPSPLHLYMEELSSPGKIGKDATNATKFLEHYVKALFKSGKSKHETLSPEIFPSFVGRIYYNGLTSIPKASFGEECNVEVHFVGPGLDATLVVTEQLEAGEGLLL